VPDRSAEVLAGGLIPYPALLKDVGRWQVIPAAPSGWSMESPDGRLVAFFGEHLVSFCDAGTGELKAVGKWPGYRASSHLADRVMDWSPDSKWVRCGFQGGRGWQNAIFIATDGSPSKAALITDAVDCIWNPKLAVVAYVLGNSRIHVVDVASGKAVEIEGRGTLCWSTDGESLLVVREDKTGQLYSRDGKPGAKFEGMDPSVMPAWSGDSSRIAAARSPNEAGIWKKDGTVEAETLKHDGKLHKLLWQPGDQLLMAAVDGGGKLHFWKPDGQPAAVVETGYSPSVGWWFNWVDGGKGFPSPANTGPASRPSPSRCRSSSTSSAPTAASS